LRRPFRYFDTHFFFPAPHLVWVISPGSIASTNAATQLSTAASAEAVSLKVMQSFGFLFSSFSKQPLVGSTPPSNFATTLSTQLLALGSGVFPGVSASWWHLIRPVPFLDMHLVLPATHFACCANAVPPCSSITESATVTSVRNIMGPPPLRGTVAARKPAQAPKG
jgi:hypothetical protein